MRIFLDRHPVASGLVALVSGLAIAVASRVTPGDGGDHGWVFFVMALVLGVGLGLIIGGVRLLARAYRDGSR